jgi:serine phosphatase RsbU (regulator of sigma subunit)
VLQVAIFDGMGHDLDAALLTDFTVAAYRHLRRRATPLEELYRSLDRLVAGRFGEGGFVTAQLATLDLARGELRLLNAGHPGPLLLRHGHVTDLREDRIALPFGLGELPSGRTTGRTTRRS